MSPGLQLLAAPALFVVGTALGYVHGWFFAIVGRPLGSPLRPTLRRLALVTLCSVPGVVIAWFITAGITVTAAAATDPRVSYLAVASAGWLLGGALCLWAAVEGWAAVRRVFARWPRARVGFLSALPAMALLSYGLLNFRPTVPGTEARLTSWASVGLAFAVTVWVFLPLLLLVLRVIPGGLATDGSGPEVGQ